MKQRPAVGIDLGTTNSEIAAFWGDRVQILKSGQASMLPSCVGMTPEGQLMIGQPARNQLLLYPERTVRSIKRKMGSQEQVSLGEQSFSPQEISALILKELANWGCSQLGQPVTQAVITVPAYFSDAQRQATREAGALAGLEVLRILNEPTAASLAYGFGHSGRQTTLIYDLGGGTFDVSIVNFEGEITEVLASHGNNQLGGDDFDELVLERLLEEFQKQHGVDLRQGQPKAMARLRWAAEEAKKQLSTQPFAQIREEALLQVKGKPIHLQMELGRDDFESMIRPLLDSTLASVSKALEGANLRASDLDAVLLVGGSTRIPLVSQLLLTSTGLAPRQEIDPDLAVALGAGVLASRLDGRDVGRVLVDVCPYSFGTSHLGLREGYPYLHCYKAILPRNTPLPLTRSEAFCTASPNQKAVSIEVFQGEDEDALKNVLIGEFRVEGLQPTEGPNLVVCRMSLDLDGILEVTATEKETGLSKQIFIQGAARQMSDQDIASARKRLQLLHQGPEFEWEEEEEEELEEAPTEPAYQQALELVLRLAQLQPRLHPDDAGEAEELRQRIDRAVKERNLDGLQAASHELSELLFFVESTPR
ncbi:Hsp70 family protein [bacterium]|nr:Hsp70 family protein [bacterium]